MDGSNLSSFVAQYLYDGSKMVKKLTKLIYRPLILASLLLLPREPLTAAPFQRAERKIEKEVVREGLIELQGRMQQSYCLRAWKEYLHGWDGKKELDSLLKRLKAEGPLLSLNDAKRYYLDFLLSAHDPHLHLSFTGSTIASLPISMIYVEDRYLIDYSEDKQLQVGDEVVLIDGLSPIDFARKMRKIAPKRNFTAPQSQWLYKQIEEREAELASRCTFFHETYHLLPKKNNVAITIRPKGANHIESHTLHWSRRRLPPHHLPNTRSFEFSQKECAEKRIGIIHLDSFTEDTYPLLKELYFSIGRLRKASDAIILDLRNNRGGSPLMGLFVAQCLVDTPLAVFEDIYPTTRESLSTLEMFDQNRKLNTIDLRKSLFEDPDQKGQKEDQGKQEEIQESWSMWRGTLKRYIDFSLISSRENLRAAKEAIERREPYYMTKTSPLLPALYAAAMPPLYILVNASSASCSEVIAYLLQKNKGAKVLGTLTRGITGGIDTFEFSPHWGLERVSITTTLCCFRSVPNREMIEDIGVIPDYRINFKLEDLSPERGRLFKEKSLWLSKALARIEHDLGQREREEGRE